MRLSGPICTYASLLIKMAKRRCTWLLINKRVHTLSYWPQGRPLYDCEKLSSSVRNFPIKSKKLYNVSAMMLAALYGMSDIVDVLRPYESGLQSAEGYTALMLAILAGSTTSATLLLHEATRQTQRGETALLFAAKVGNKDLVDRLIPYEAKVVTNYGSTALMEACRAGTCPLSSSSFLTKAV